MLTLIQDESAIGVDGEKSAAAANTPPPPGGDRQLMAVCTDKGAVVYALPSHRDTIQQKKNCGLKNGLRFNFDLASCENQLFDSISSVQRISS